MTIEEIKRTIEKKGYVAKTAFYVFFDYYMAELENGVYPFYYNEDFIVIMSYNTTILLMERIRDNQHYYEKECNINKRIRNRMLKDMKTMTLQRHPDGTTNYDYERHIVNAMPFYEEVTQ